MINVLLWIWQFPQNFIGYLMTRKFTMKNCRRFRDEWVTVYFTENVFGAGVCLGKYILLDYYKCCGKESSKTDFFHECGHMRQSKMLGWLYLPLVGLPSAIRNIWDRLFHRKWSTADRISWYYKGYPERWADRLGDVIR